MTNLSDLFPAGAGKQVSFVADGAISAAGKPVVLTTAGKAAPIGGASAALGSPVLYSVALHQPGNVSSTFDVNANRVVIVFEDADGAGSDYGTCSVGTVSGTSISFGTPVVFASVDVNYTGCCYDANAQKIVIAYGNADIGTAIVGTVSGTTISFGSPTVFNTPGNSNYPSPVYDSNAQKVAIGFQDGDNSDYGSAIVGTVSGTSISFGSATVFQSAATPHIGGCFDSTNNKVVYAYSNQTSSSHGTAVVGTVSGTSISFGTPVVFNTSSTSGIAPVYDTANQKVVVGLRDEGDSDKGKSIVGTVSGTAISFGTAVVFEAGSTDDVSACYDTAASSQVISYRDRGDTGKGKLIVGVVSGTSISFNSPVTFNAVGDSTRTSTVYDSTAAQVVTAYRPSATDDGYAIVSTTPYTNLSASSFLGVSDAAILDTASGNVTIKGGIAATGLTSLTPASDYYAQTDGTISTSSSGDAVKIGKAMSATSINLEYQS